jgi:hypothetical protein
MAWIKFVRKVVVRLSSTSGLFSIYLLSLNNKYENLLSAAEKTIGKLNELVPPFH